jgi:hypothetical protein
LGGTKASTRVRRPFPAAPRWRPAEGGVTPGPLHAVHKKNGMQKKGVEHDTAEALPGRTGGRGSN